MNNIEKLLKISSSPIKDNTPNKANVNDKDLYNLLNHRNGFYAFESALHVFSDDELKEINTLIKSEKLYKDIENCIYFAEDIFGNLFCMKNNRIYMFDVETEKLDYIVDSIGGWTEEILKDYNFLTGYSLAHEWQIINGKLDDTKRLVPKQLFVLGGKYTIENLGAQDRFDALRYRSDIAQQLKNVKDGEQIVLNIRE